MPDKHAFLSASSAHRWMRCTSSPALCAGMEERESPYAREGTDAHSLCEHKVLKALGRESADPTEGLEHYDREMEDCAEEYRNFVMEQVEEARGRCGDPLVLVEQRLDFSRWVPEAFGTGDCVIVADGVLTVIDFKYGVGVLVSAEGNPQMRCYALGALDEFGCLYDVESVRMCIFQPRRGNVSISEVPVGELLSWASSELAPRARLAYEGKGDFEPGDHCVFCAAKAVCRARAERNMELARYDFEPPATLGDDEIAAILARADELVSWAGDVKDYALQKAVSGTRFAGFKVVEGRSNRKYADEDAVAAAVSAAGYDPYERKVLGITAMTALLGRRQFDEILGGLVVKPQGKPTLVPESDKRPEMTTIIEDFKEGK